MQGSVKFYNEKKGYGFIKGDDGKDYFFHVSNVAQEDGIILPEDTVEFDTKRNKRGTMAINVKVV